MQEADGAKLKPQSQFDFENPKQEQIEDGEFNTGTDVALTAR